MGKIARMTDKTTPKPDDEVVAYRQNRLETDATFKAGWDAYCGGHACNRRWPKAQIAGWLNAKNGATR